MSANDLEQLIAEFQTSGLRELHVRHDGLEIYLSNDADAAGLDGVRVSQAATVSAQAAAIAAPVAVQPAAVGKQPAGIPEGAVIVAAPYLGTFYRSPKPGSDPYVEVGQSVAADMEICLVEVMKLFTAVRAETAGTIHAVLAEDGEMVAADQPLFVILPV